MKKVALGCVFLLTACSGDAGETASQPRTDTAQQAIALLQAGDHEAMKDCGAVVAACESTEQAANHCERIAEHCEAFDDFLRGSREPVTSCWQGCIEGEHDVEECRGMSHAHDDGRRRGLECLDEISECDSGDCALECGVDFDGPFSRGHGQPPGSGDGDWPEGAGGGWLDGDAGGAWSEAEGDWGEDEAGPLDESAGGGGLDGDAEGEWSEAEGDWGEGDAWPLDEGTDGSDEGWSGHEEGGDGPSDFATDADAGTDTGVDR